MTGLAYPQTSSLLVASYMVGMTVGVHSAEIAVAVVSCPSSCKATVAAEFLVAATECGPLAGQENYLLVNLTNNGSASAADSATENVGL